MRKRRPFAALIGAAVVVLVGMIVAGAFREREPEYGGKRLSEWVIQLDPINFGGAAVPPEGLAPVRSIGVKAIPFLLNWIQYEQPASKARLFEFMNETAQRIHWPWTIYHDDESRMRGAVGAFKAFEKQAGIVVPELSAILKNERTSMSTRGNVLMALRHFGQEAVPPVLTVLTNRQEAGSLRYIAASNLGLMVTNADQAIAVFRTCLDDDDLLLSAMAAFCLSHLKVEPGLVIPRLLENLAATNAIVRHMALSSFLRYGSEARAAVPALLKMRNHVDVQKKRDATTALLAIEPAAVITNRLE